MSNVLPILLAQQTNATDEATVSTVGQLVRTSMTHMDILHHPDVLLDNLSNLPFIAGSILVALGLLCVFNGYRWHRWVVIILAFCCGLGIGEMLSDNFGKSSIVAVSLGSLCAIVATPLQKVAVAIFGGLTGAFIGANIWTAFNAESSDLHWAGAAMGFIALALASVIVFRLVIVLFTSVGGAAMTVFGAIVLMLQVDGWAPAVRSSLSSNQLLLPVLVLLAAVGSFVLQESRSRAELDAEG